MSMTSQAYQDLQTLIQSAVVNTIQGGSSHNAQQNPLQWLLDQERTDQNFHKYAFIKEVRQRIEGVIGPELDARLQEVEKQGGIVEPLLAQTIALEIMKSPIHSALVSSLVEDVGPLVNAAVEQALPKRPFSAALQRFPPPQTPSCQTPGQSQHSSFYFSGQNGGPGGVPPSSFSYYPPQQQHAHDHLSIHHQASWESECSSAFSLNLFPTPDELQVILMDLQPSQPVEIRRAAAKTLSTYSCSDLLSGELWNDFKSSLEAAMNDADTHVVEKALGMYAKMFKSTPAHMNGEVYCSFVSHLLHLGKKIGTKVASGLDIQHAHTTLLLKKFRLLNHLQHELPMYWLRFPENVFSECLTLTCELLNPDNATTGHVSSIHLLGVVDPTASWFRQWMVSHHGRSRLIQSMKKTTLLKNIASRFLNYASCLPLAGSISKMMSDELVVMDADTVEETESPFLISHADLEYVEFLYSIVVLVQLLISREGRTCFPICFDTIPPLLKQVHLLKQPSISTTSAPADKDAEPVEPNHISNEDASSEIKQWFNKLSVEVLLKIIISLMCSSSKVGLSLTADMVMTPEEAESRLNLSRFLCLMLRDVATSNIYAREHLYKDDLLLDLISPIQLILSEAPNILVNQGSHRIHHCDENVLINIAEVLSNIAAFESGRKFLLGGEMMYLKQKREDVCYGFTAHLGNRSPLHAVARLIAYGFNSQLTSSPGNEISSIPNATIPTSTAPTPNAIPSSQVASSSNTSSLAVAASSVTALDVANVSGAIPIQKVSKMEDSVANLVSYRVLGAFLFLLRQLYRTCEGVLFLHEYKLHSILSSHLPDSNEPYFPGPEGLPNQSHITSTSAAPSPSPLPARSAMSSPTSSSFHPSPFQDNSAHQGDISSLAWKEMCLDNLVNFAGTPKGVLLLYQTGRIDPCVSYMFERYKKKMQVSRCEKFGYGVLLSQLSTTAPGLQALYKTGLVEYYMKGLWNIVESHEGSFPELALDDYNARKVMGNVFKLFCSFPALSCCIHLELEEKKKRTSLEPPHSQSRIKNTLCYILQTLALQQDGSEWLEDVVHREEATEMGLRILQMLIYSLDSFVLLQSVFRFQDILFRILEHDRLSGHDIIDENHILMKQILLSSWFIGGTLERKPPLNLERSWLGDYMLQQPELYYYASKSHRYEAPTVECRHVSEVSSEPASCPPSVNTKVRVSLEELLEQSASDESALHAWISHAKMYFIQFLESEASKELQHVKDVYRKLLPLLLEKIVKADSNVTSDSGKWLTSIPGWQPLSLKEPSASKQHPSPSSEMTPQQNLDSIYEEVGIEVVSRYAKTLHSYLSPNQKNPQTQSMSSNGESPFSSSQLKRWLHFSQQAFYPLLLHSKEMLYHGFDWFVATLYLLFLDGNSKEGEASVKQHPLHNCLEAISQLDCSIYLWPKRAAYLSSSDIPLLYSNSLHMVETILELELPLVSSAFTLSGCTPSQIAQTWLRELFWNVMAFPDILHILCLSILHGIDYQIYVCIAVFKHLEKGILLSSREKELIQFLSERHLYHFSLVEYMPWMQGLQEKYRDEIMKEMRRF